MVGITRIFLWIHLLFLPFLLDAATMNVTVNKNTLFQGQPIEGEIEILHNPSEIIDLGSIKLDNIPLETQTISNNPAQGQIRTILRFYIDKQEPGLHVLPAVTVNVGTQRLTSYQSTYYVSSNTVNPTKPNQNSSSPGQVWLKIERFVDGKTDLYPGQYTTLGYRYYFNGDMQLQKENLPLLDAEGFKKVGDVVIKTTVNNSNHTAVREMTQRVQAVKPGDYEFAESHVSGYVYQLSGNQQIPLYNIEASAAPLKITVKAFPEDGKPTSFNGAIGSKFSFAVRLLSLPEVSVGDKFTIALEISGTGDFDNLPMPEVCCQPGFSGNFQQSDIPPAGIMKGNAKVYVVDIRPLTTQISQIPSIEFSYFNPETGKYTTLQSNPIAVIVHAANEPFNQGLQEAEQNVNSKANQETDQEMTPPSKIEIGGNVPLKDGDLKDKSFGSWWVLFLIPIALFLIWFQKQMKQSYEAQKSKKTEESSAIWLAKAKEAGNDIPRISQYLEKAFIRLLYEKKLIPSDNISAHQLHLEGASGDVRRFLLQIEENRFTGKGIGSSQEILTEAQKLYDDISRSKVSS